MNRRFCSLLIAAVAAFALPLSADAPPLIDCPWVNAGGDQFKDYGFYVTQYPGTSLSKVTVYLDFATPGTYLLSLTARAGSFGGTLLGTATQSVVVSPGDQTLPVAFSFASPAVVPQTPVTFAGAIVSGPPSFGFVFMAVYTPSGCPVVEVAGSNPPFGSYNRMGIAVRIEGTSPGNPPQTTTIPSVASIHGVNGSFFHTDLWLFNRDSNDLTVTARFRCLTGLSCTNTPATFTVGAFAGLTITNVVPSLFGVDNTAGALELTVNPKIPAALYALSRTYTPALPAATTGASIAALPASAANGDAVFVGIAGSGGNLSAGFRTNVGVYNPQEVSTSVSFYLHTTTGTQIGNSTLSLAPHEARQLNDIFAAVGKGSVVSTDAVLYVVSDVPIFSFATVIDNRTGDFVYQGTTVFF